jgi:Leucine rich repeat N-terminal domain
MEKYIEEKVRSKSKLFFFYIFLTQSRAMKRQRYRLIFPLLWLLVVYQIAEFCASVNDEGAIFESDRYILRLSYYMIWLQFFLFLFLARVDRMLLNFKEMVQPDLSNWDETSMDPCSLPGVECSIDGKIVAL